MNPLGAHPYPAASERFAKWQRHHDELTRLCGEISQLLREKERLDRRCKEIHAEHLRLLQERRQVPHGNHEAALNIQRAQQQNLASLQQHWDSTEEIIPELVRNFHDLERQQEDHPGWARS